MSPYITITAKALLNIWSGSQSASSLRALLPSTVCRWFNTRHYRPLQTGIFFSHAYIHQFPLPSVPSRSCPAKGTYTDRSHTRSAVGSFSSLFGWKRREKSCLCEEVPQGAPALDAGPDQCDLNSNAN